MQLPLFYIWRSLLRQKLNTLLTFVVVSIVVGVLSVLLSFAAGIRTSLAATGSPRNLMILKPGATAECTSLILPEESARVVQAPGIARDARGAPLVSLELSVQTAIARRESDQDRTNVSIRGVDEVAFVVHDEVRIVEGRTFSPGAMEVIVGRAARDRYADLQLGGEIRLGRSVKRNFQVVGIFESGGSALENEIWAPRTLLEDVYGRRFVTTVVVRLAGAEDADEAIRYLKGPAVRLDARREPDYYADLSNRVHELVLLASILVGVMAFGAVFAVANTMYSAVDGRRREIAMLRAIGFERGAIIVAFLIESFLMCAAACITGLVGSAFFQQPRQDFMSDITWTALAYESRFTVQTMSAALGLALTVGLIGGVAPAIKASRTRIIEALRKA